MTICKATGHGPRFQDLTGKRFGKLTVIDYAGTNAKRAVQWRCRCDCGKEKIVTGQNLRAGITKSCGCLHRETITKHGKSRSGCVEYERWNAMKSRCSNANKTSFHRYRGRGIKVCKRWQNSFASFFRDMGTCPGPEFELDRIDNDKGYYPGNVRWASRKQQVRNTSNNRVLTFQGQTRATVEWSEILGINRATIAVRLFRGKTTEQALQPVQKK